MNDSKFSKENLTEKIRNLLNRAEGTDSEAERDSCVAAAARLMEAYSIDQAYLEATGNKKDRGKIIDVRIPITAPFADEKLMLLHGIAKHYRCRIIKLNSARGNKGTVHVHMFGYEDDLEWTALMFQSLLIQQAGMMVVAQNDKPEYEPVRGWRMSFMAGFSRTVSERIAVAMNKEREDQHVESTGVALVLADRKKMVGDAVRSQYPILSSGRGKSYGGGGYGSGREAGNRANLGQSSISGNRGQLNA